MSRSLPSRVRRFLYGPYVWAICHDLCLCGIDRKLNRVTRGPSSWLSYWCGRLDQWIPVGPDEEETDV